MKKRAAFILTIALLSFAGVSYASHQQFGREIVNQKQNKNGSGAGADLSKPAGDPASEHAAASAPANDTSGENAAGNSTADATAVNSTQTAAGGTNAGLGTASTSKTDSSKPSLNQEVKLDVTAQSQEPELYNGCEVTSLSMLLSAAGHPVYKLQLADDIAKDPTPEVRDEEGNTLSWGDPNVGFVGDVTGENRGYGVYHGPVFNLLKKYIGSQAQDLTGKSFDDVEAAIAAGHPVVVWTTVEFKPSSAWVTWKGPNGPVKATLDEHAVLLVGFNDSQLFVNDPLDGTAAKAVDKDSFIAAWKELGSQAVTYTGN